ncbi:MAG: PD-(D/E)XK nuclease family protein [Capsulimonadaceae bacterium]
MDSTVRYPVWPPKGQSALSYSNVQIYDKCRRKWFFQYLTNLAPRHIAFDVSVQKKLRPVTMLAGAIVDAVVKNAMRVYMRDRVWRPDLKRDARKAMQFFADHSQLFAMAVDNREKWPVPRHTWLRPLDMVYYETTVSASQEEATMAIVDRCLVNFIRFLQDEELYDCDPSGWRIPESGDKPNPWFWSGDIPIYAGYDFVVLDGDRARIIDWKAGKSERNEYGAREQLTWYATYVHDEWELEFDRMTLQAVWLQEDNKVTATHAEPAGVDAVRRRWEALYAEQGEAIRQANEAPNRYEELFPMTDDLMACFFCPFRSCIGRTRLAALHIKEVVEIEGAGEVFYDT